MEVGKVGVNLQYPVRLNEDDGTDKYETGPSREKWLDLHPGDKVVQAPRDIKGYGGDG